MKITDKVEGLKFRRTKSPAIHGGEKKDDSPTPPMSGYLNSLAGGYYWSTVLHVPSRDPEMINFDVRMDKLTLHLTLYTVLEDDNALKIN